MDWAIIGDLLRVVVLAGLVGAGLLTVMIWKKNLATKITYIRLVVQVAAFATLFFIFSFSIPSSLCVSGSFCNDNCFRQVVLWLALPLRLVDGHNNYGA